MNPVGPVLQKCAVAAAVIRALQERHQDLSVLDQGSYLRVRTAPPCVLARTRVEELLGEPFELPSDLERIMPSFRGTLRITSEQAQWT